MAAILVTINLFSTTNGSSRYDDSQILKLLDKGELSVAINIDISYASKKAIEKVEKQGGKVNLIKGI